ncbi:Crp/Fnr family transcriptional regulator [Vibrio sp. WXL210]|uniref:Crp/Fnr family transcriptional regulator n=1 Tax=Vibrio sp. WXL210 TaxID=3450709 RepID=UPI003EC60A9B
MTQQVAGMNESLELPNSTSRLMRIKLNFNKVLLFMLNAHDAYFDGFSHIFSAEEYPLLHRQFETEAIRKVFEPGEQLVYQQEPLKRMGYLVKGQAEIEVVSADGGLLAAGIVSHGCILNAPAYLDGQRSPVALIAKQRCEVLFLSYKKLRLEPQLDREATLLAGICATYLYRFCERLLTSALMLSLKEQVIQWLIRLQGDSDSVTITAEKLATHLVVSKHKIHRALKELEKEGRIENAYGTVKVVKT